MTSHLHPGMRSQKQRPLPPSVVFLASGLVTLLLWLTTPNQIAFITGMAAFLLLLAAWWSYWNWRRTGFRGLPLLAAVTAMYWLYFGVPLFYGDRRALDWRHPFRWVREDAVTETMLLVVFGVLFLWLGMNCKLGRRLAPSRLPEFSRRPWVIPYLQAVAVLGPLSGLLQFSFGGEGLRQIIAIGQDTVPLAAFVVLLRRALESKVSLFDKAVLLLVVAIRALGISSGWMGGLLALGMTSALVYLQVRRKLAIGAFALVIPYVLFFSAGKSDFREVYWTRGMQGNTSEKLGFWVDASWKRWQTALDEPSGSELRSMLTSTLMRTSLLTQAANVIEQTPAIVPYQYGRLYSYLIITWIPRFLWPDKPSMSEANQFYQVAYQVTPKNEIGQTSIAVGVLTEGYINFGWYGTALVMFLVGLLLDFWNETFLTGKNLLAMGVGFAIVPQLLMVEYQMAQYVSGIVQDVIMILVVFFPTVQWRNTKAKVMKSEALSMAGVQS